MDGIAPRHLTAWLRTRAQATPPLDFSPITGGRSNLTYRVTDTTGRRWVLRRPPLHSVVASAHDVAREYRIIAALQGTEVPVPRLIGLEQDEAITGAPFYVMEYVDGLVLRTAEDVEALDTDARRAVAFNLADTLADLHAIDVDQQGLGQLGKREGYVERQLRRWMAQYVQGSQREIPLVARVRDRLAAMIPEQASATIVHGDYRLDNAIVGHGGTIRAVLDWELCALGDPMADLGLLQVYWAPPDGLEIPGLPTAGAAAGIPPIEEVAHRYAERSGRDLAHLDFYVAFGYWKLAVILEGVYSRYASGAYGETDGSEEVFGDIVLRLLELSDRLCRTSAKPTYGRGAAQRQTTSVAPTGTDESR